MKTLTINIPELLIDGSDEEFREFISLLNSVATRIISMRRHLSQLFGSTAAEFGVLLVVAQLEDEKGGAKIRSIAEHMHVASTHGTSNVGSLEKLGWVSKTQDPKDSRALSVKLTPLARERFKEFAPFLSAINDRWFDGMDKEEFFVVKRFLARFVDQHDSAVHKAKELKIPSVKQSIYAKS